MAENLYKMKAPPVPRQADYTGHTLWNVTHPNHGSVDVKARDMPGAIVTAASVWGERWQRYGFYAFCDVTRIKREAKNGK